LKALAVEWDEKKRPATRLSEQTVLEGSYNPLSRPLFLYVNLKSLEKPEVLKFVEFYLAHVETLAQEVKYIPLPPSAYEKVRDRLKKRQKGTAFAGHGEMAVPIDEILSRPLVP
jgi:phosphate transport system substrate-binding protein